jgi:hypothetical protein
VPTTKTSTQALEAKASEITAELDDLTRQLDDARSQKGCGAGVQLYWVHNRHYFPVGLEAGPEGCPLPTLSGLFLALPRS